MEEDLQIGEVTRSIYLHIPFCLSQCEYCSFFSLPYSRSEVARYHSVLLDEIDLYQAELSSIRSDSRDPFTVYFGGGSPSLLSADQINSILSKLLAQDPGSFPCPQGSELTLEINPIQITPDYLIELRKTPINRLSLGLQSMHDSDLAFLGRRHKSDQIQHKLKLCREAGYDNISMDLMYGLPGMSLDSLEAVLEQYLWLCSEHISCYLLSLEPESAMYQRGVSLPDDETCAAQYQLICKLLAGSGFVQYEISNFSRPGYHSRHNLAYWKSRNYLALGASAAGFVDGIRYQNEADLPSYYRSVSEGIIYPNKQSLSREDLKSEYIMMRLRLLKGLSLSEYKAKFGTSFLEDCQEPLAKMQKLGMLSLSGDSIRLTKEALFVSNAVIAELI